MSWQVAPHLLQSIEDVMKKFYKQRVYLCSLALNARVYFLFIREYDRMFQKSQTETPPHTMLCSHVEKSGRGAFRPILS